MKISGTYMIDAPREQVWAALNDIDVLARVVPGCERLEQTGENEFEGTVKIGIQSIKGTYQGRIRLQDIQPPHHYKLVANGRGSNGVVDGSGSVDLVEQDGKTVLNYSGEAAIGGTLASVGQRLIEGASRQLIGQSLKALVEQIRLRNAPPAEAPAVAEAPPPAASSNGVAPVVAPEPAVATTAPAPPANPVATATVASPSFERRSVVVPEDEQLKPEDMVSGMIKDIVAERPWLPWVIVAFVIGFLFGRAGR